MKEFPITKYDYDKSVIITDFISLFKTAIQDKKNINNLLFKPQKDGYLITFLFDEAPSYIVLSFRKSPFLKAKVTVKCKLGAKKEQKFISESNETNQMILNKILESNTTTSGE